MRNSPGRHQNVTLHLLGGIAATDLAREMAGDRVVLDPSIAGSCRDFRAQLAASGWDIGIAPLRRDGFNDSQGARQMGRLQRGRDRRALHRGWAGLCRDCQAGAALLSGPEGWEAAGEELILSPTRAALVELARSLLIRSYSWERAEKQVLALVAGLTSTPPSLLRV